MVKPDRELYEPPYDDALMYDTVEEPQGPRGRPLVVLLGIVVLAAFAGVVWVAYNQGVKEGQRTNPPVLAADSGPTRITPESQAATAEPAHTDKTLARLSGEADVPPSEEQIMPQPEEPRPLPSPQEVTTTAPPPSPARLTAPPAPTISAPPAEAQAESDHPGLDTTVSPVSPLPLSARHAVSAQTTHATPPVSASEDLTAALPPAADGSVVQTAPTAKPPTVKKPKPIAAAVPALPALPHAMAASTTVAPSGEGGPLVTTKPTETASLEPGQTPENPSAGTVGPIAIQLGSFPTDLLAAASWSKIKTSNSGVLGDYSPKFRRAEVEGKGTWYRLQVTGFADKAAAQDVCNKLKANGQACIITTAK